MNRYTGGAPNGWLNIYKPKNLSSARIVSMIKKAFAGVKCGHAGTLDPLAEGVLPIALGEATKLCDMLVNAKKKYEFLMQLGTQTSSGDADGEIINQRKSSITKKQIIDVLPQFKGSITQVPSSFSAIKINGVRAYKLARENIQVTIPKRNIEIYQLELLDFDAEKQHARIVAECSKGTYVRTLAEDIAFSLQNFAFVLELRRISVGKFTENTAYRFVEPNMLDIQNHVLPIDFVLDDIPVINISEENASRVRYGQKIHLEQKAEGVIALISNGVLISIGEVKNGIFCIKRVFNI